MRIKELALERFGPFASYRVSFPTDDEAYVLLTGRNNEGKSTIISALRLLHAGMRVAKRGRIGASRDLRKQDLDHVDIRRLVHNYEGGIAEIRGVFS